MSAKDRKAADKKAMDAAITDAVAKARKTERDIRTAEDVVRPYIGKVAAMDSAEDVYKTALVALGVDVTDVHPSAFRSILKTIPVPGSGPKPAVAQDAASVTGFFSRFPEAKTHQVKTL